MCGHHPGESSGRQLGLHERQVQFFGWVVCSWGCDQGGGGDQEPGVRVGASPERDDWLEQDGGWAVGE